MSRYPFSIIFILYLFLLQVFVTEIVIPELHRTGPVQREVPGGGGRPEHHGQRWIYQRQVRRVLRGLCHELNNFLDGLKNQISTCTLSEYGPIVLKFFYCLVVEKMKDKVLACVYENTY
jgi:hypothetical protein